MGKCITLKSKKNNKNTYNKNKMVIKLSKIIIKNNKIRKKEILLPLLSLCLCMLAKECLLTIKDTSKVSVTSELESLDGGNTQNC